MYELPATTLDCPYCGERVSVELDTGGEAQDFIEDCPVCCRAIEFTATLDATGAWQIHARRDDESF